MKNKLAVLFTLLLCLVLCLFTVASCGEDKRDRDDDDDDDKKVKTEEIKNDTTEPSDETGDTPGDTTTEQHAHSYTNVVTAPTCTEMGYTTHSCACGDSYVDTYVNAFGHIDGNWITDKKATCTEAGEKHRVCGVCGVTIDNGTIPATGHVYTETVVEPTCTEKGYTKHSCACGDSYVDTYVNALGHVDGNWITDKKATCTEIGEKHRVCGVCGVTIDNGTIPATGHVYTETVVEPTCTEKGYTKHSCACGDSYVDSYVDENGVHTVVVDNIEAYKEYVTVVFEFSSKCSSCGEKYPVRKLEYDDPSHDKLAFENIGAKNAGKVSENYEAVGMIGISSLSEITDPYGSYYLTADISANEYTVSEFYGLLDCCGYTVTTAVPLFDTLGGAVINLNLCGEISYASNAKAPLANVMENNAIILNVKNTCNVTVKESTTKEVYAGGFAVYVYGKDVIFLNCEYAGTITNVYNAKGNNRYTGGFVGSIRADSTNGDQPIVEFISCTYSGTATASSHVGGLVGECVTPAEVYLVGCLSDGEIKNVREGQAAGLLGYMSGEKSGFLGVVNCANKTEVVGASDAAGLVGTNSAGGDINEILFSWCTNYAKITGRRYVGGMVARIKGETVISDCVNFADLVADPGLDESTRNPGPAVTRHYMGGILGFADKNGTLFYTVTYVNCINYGKINASSTNCRLGGISGHHELVQVAIANCLNFGDITSNYVAPNEYTGDHRIGGIVGSVNGESELYNCVNFGDIRSQMGKWGQPTGGIIAYVSNFEPFILSNCMNYGDIDVTVPSLANNYFGTVAAGLAGRVTGTATILVDGCLNAGVIKSDYGIADFVNFEKGYELVDTVMAFSNSYFIEQNPGQCDFYANFLCNDQRSAYDVAVPEGYNMIINAFMESTTKDQIEDSMETGLAAVMNKKAGEVHFSVAKIRMTDGTVVKCVIPVAVVNLIANDIVG